ncbi:MAG: bifunctional adenosylcobinamide kinase/adenosylcobinamide-phosphate guanylyltransferase [Lachnospiraceae bacterium]|nr:bifunctional adenosylcobinamide kinase/adenosylcobinamide-phosphate guanylyltransferase [Lachnospiraceae bacterium]
MMTVIIGGSGSGKSSFAEEYTQRISNNMQKYYLATMQVFGEDGRKKVERHRNMRNGKGFATIEQTVSIKDAIDRIKVPSESTILLECMSNLAANEMFWETGQKPEDDVVETVLSDINVLREKLAHLVVVTNNVFEDGIIYDESTMAYICALGRINRALTNMADEVVEVVVGIPIMIKKGN